MSLTGSFDDQGRPFMEGDLYLPEQGISVSLSFLVDTGSDQTLLLPSGTAKLGIDFDRLGGARGRMGGVGGAIRYALTPARLAFFGSSIYTYELEIAIAEPERRQSPVDALLGRDILERWYLHYERRSRLLRAENVSADEIRVLPDDAD